MTIHLNLNLNRANQASLFLTTLAALRVASDPATPEDISRHAYCEAIAFHAGKLPLILTLAEALESQMRDAADGTDWQLDMDVLHDICGDSDVARLGAEIAGFRASTSAAGVRWATSRPASSDRMIDLSLI